ncbi:hypothetical protein BO70DRAFT_358971 [Aspergillus heteromorphus CBS 117.55]|uniref:MJ1316 RNA cyclic group end recognition domain-containing protein n=1 Tax=Aspergillus heteromorphus CBS 117.55 TaxID=1448321 RepID=A0A317WXM5_9EURO|nr:uncharacterized protein BO70DRAFT_358971 [Aspergillus heteromorphus CBS 117.55]PWY89977.1 hypothetical protein BO70DRAFT_358971 [Aspergillus heteromorphus CBS 117.55]
MASEPPSDAQQENASRSSTPQPDVGSRTPTPLTSPVHWHTPKPEPVENRLRPAADIINRIIWDDALDASNYVIGYEDRFEGRLEAVFNSWKKETTDEEFIPQHRILYIKRRSDGEVVWDRRRRIDRIFMSGNSAFDYLAFLS